MSPVIESDKVSRKCERQAKGVFSGALRIGTCRCYDHNSEVIGRRKINIVGPDTGPRYYFQPCAKLEQRPSYRSAISHDERPRSSHELAEFSWVAPCCRHVHYSEPRL